VQLFGKDLEQEVVVVAEIGVNHEGDVEAASTLLRLAAKSGADAVKFQTFSPTRYISSSDPERLERVTKFSLDKKSHQILAEEAKNLGVGFFSTPVTEDMVDFVSGLGPAIKIASGDLTFESVIRKSASTGKTIILSTGCGSVEEIDLAVRWVEDEVGSKIIKNKLILMHCVSSYPTPHTQANILSIPFLSERYDLKVGYSNHVIGSEVCIASVALGACIVEVHFTDQSTGRSFRDHSISFEPDKFTKLVSSVRIVRDSLGDYSKNKQECEIENESAIRKGIVAANNLDKGHIISRDDLMFARPASEFLSSEISMVIGKKLNKSISFGNLICRSDIN